MSAVLETVAAHAERTPGRVALAWGSRSLDYRALHEAVAGVAEILHRRIAGAEGPVAIQLANGPAWVILDLALIALGRPCVPLPPFFTPDQTQGALTDCGAAWIAGGEGNEAVGDPLMIAGERVFLSATGTAPRPLPAGVAKISYTSGSTGAPKGVCLSASQLERVASSIVGRFGPKFAGVHLPVLPLGVLLENVAGLYAVLLAGGAYRVEPPREIGCADPFRPDFAALAQAVADRRATSLILVPELLRGLIAAQQSHPRDLGALQLVAVGGAKVAPELVSAGRALGLPVYEGYGLTECGSVVAVNAPGEDRPGTVGRPLDHVDVVLAEDGEIVVRGRTFLGYAGGDPAPERVATGDVGALDADGFLSVSGRKDNVVVTSFGRNVSPEWIESELQAEPQVRLAIVAGDGRSGLRALVTPTAPDVGPEALAACVARANARLPAYARVTEVQLYLPRPDHFTANGKIRRAVALGEISAPSPERPA